MARRQRLIDAAHSLRQEFGLGHGAVDPFAILRDLGVQVVRHAVSEGPDGTVDGIYWYRFDMPFVFVNSAKDMYRQRFTAAHELGHFRIDPRPDQPVVDEDVVASKEQIHKEKNWFAGALLIDSFGAQRLRDEGLEGDHLVAATMDRFDVSLPAAAIALADLGLLSVASKAAILDRLEQGTITSRGLLNTYSYRVPRARAGGEELDPAFLADVKVRYESGALSLAMVAGATRMGEDEAAKWLRSIGAAAPAAFTDSDEIDLMDDAEFAELSARQ